MIENEVKKKEKKNENLLIDLCECFVFLCATNLSILLSICLPCLLKAASKKDETEEAQKEVEMALLALSNIKYYFIERELYLKEITEIIEHHQKHRNLTHLAYQSAWKFLNYQFFVDNSLEDTVANELHFVGEAARELEELTRNVDWNRKKGEEGGKETKEEFILIRWVETIAIYFLRCKLENEEFIGLLSSIVQVYRAAKDNHSVISNLCISSLRNAAERRVVRIEDLFKGGAVEAVLEEIQRQTLNEGRTNECFKFFMNVSRKLKEKNKDEREEEERKATKRKIFEKMEEEGYEDIIISFHETLKIFNRRYYYGLSLKISDYFVNV
ncbi:uncharacterized protein MONOS_7995 [Monocercomonoides exilis]|uniref:uncharacterized protein n=1 Tax=Monocercomonoides exilis TaxID=2049356 RepID=UPI003559AB6D|nr:hypothetical protein MONOS_7995 [Monocercomonoides exilis]|eukprot:MONOS_7995.1-p1 / transcript=MONOS_7995.1 / gene=MONOS_7995 / organism=Monocercomonoides_exilis_PA203 / gene_product=unspecified product / transcript_product=unspecified product / location=Mono_scaffold00290:10439-11483(-) / protein_length=328 / sequence_SO=supercontig / SO=protein_coding / is_pseudo=false